jgi:DNA-binding CsgD family transcriptional regulator
MDDKSVLEHTGTKRHSGRYPWGSGEDPFQNDKSSNFAGYVRKLKNAGLSEGDIVKYLGFKSSSVLRAKVTISKEETRAADRVTALKLHDKGMSNTAIGIKMNKNESSIRDLLNPALSDRVGVIRNTANAMKYAVDKKGYVQVGLGTNYQLGVSQDQQKVAIHMLEEQGYKVHYIDTMQMGTGKYTRVKVLAKPGVEYSEISANREKIGMVYDEVRTLNRGENFIPKRPPEYISSNRVMIRYKEQGGDKMDGVIQLRRGVDDLDLGTNYAQVRIGVDGTHYLKGMAIYSDNMPKGVDIIYNSTKSAGTPKEKVFKPIHTEDPDNPFGASIKPGGQRGAINKVYEEGDWNQWSRTLSSQFLSKQPLSLAKKQLDLAYDIKKEEFNNIMRLTNPTVKKVLLKEFSDDADAAAIELKGAPLPGQKQHVILPLNTIKETEIYAPLYENGTKVVLVRHPHGGTFELPQLTVNNKSKEGQDILGKQPSDAVGIHPKVAEKLSGADFDGDSVIVIPNMHKDISVSESLSGLRNFNPRETYKKYDGMKVMPEERKGLYMGDISNLITDMTIKGALGPELARAIKHSMVVIDAPKHELDFKKSYEDNGIAELKALYQGGKNKGAATLVSRSKSQKYVPDREDRYSIDPNTGEKIYQLSGKSRITKYKKGDINPDTNKPFLKDTIISTPKRLRSNKMAETKDAFTLSSGTRMESVYAKHANDLKALANTARLAYLKTPNLEYSPTAKKTYAPEVSLLKAKLRTALQNKPYERMAQLIARHNYLALKAANPHLTKDQLKKAKFRELDKARLKVGAKKDQIVITDKEWEAIQNGAISHNFLYNILLNSDTGALKQRAMPRVPRLATPAKQARMKALAAAGYTQSEIAAATGLSVSTVNDYVK